MDFSDDSWDSLSEGDCPNCSGTGYDDGQCYMCGGTGSAFQPLLPVQERGWAPSLRRAADSTALDDTADDFPF